MRHLYKQALLGAVLCAAASCASFAQTTVAGTTPGQFSVNESGAATYSIPIQVPPGVAGMQPQLSLGYNSQSGNGLLGKGWDLGGLSSIARCPRTMYQDGFRGSVNYDLNDRYCMDGQRLILVSGTEGAAGAEYRTEKDSFHRIIASGTTGNGPAYFTVQTKSGLTMEYGNTVDSRIEAQGKPTARVWAINKLSDAKANFFTITYAEDGVNGEYYPSRIDYAGNTAAGQSPVNSVRFVYEPRSDANVIYHAGSMVKNSVRMTKVQAYQGATLVKDYRLSYDNGGMSGSSRLLALAECDKDGGCLSPITLAWQTQSGMFDARVISTILTSSASPSYWTLQLGDFNGDGKTDTAMTHNGTDGWYVQISLAQSDGTFGPRTLYTITTANCDESYWTLRLADFNGDGKTDMALTRNGAEGWYIQTSLAQDDGTFGPKTLSTVSTGSSNPPYWTLRFADFNGDGKTDMALTHNGTDGWYIQTSLAQSDGTFGPRTLYTITTANCDESYWTPQLADFNGDGKTDMALTRNGAEGWYIQTSLVQEDGTFGSKTVSTVSTGPSNPPYWTLRFADFNGDGKADMALTHNDTDGWYIQTSLSRGDGSFGARTLSTITTVNSDASYWTLQLADFNGDGKTDTVLTRNGAEGWYILTSLAQDDGTFGTRTLSTISTGPSNAPYWVLRFGDFNGDGKTEMALTHNDSDGWYVQTANSFPIQDRVASVSKGPGETLQFVHKPITDNTVYTKDSSPNAAVYPKIDLQYPQYVVSSVASSNGLGGVNTIQYNYGGLKAEQGTGRGSLGFRWMKSKSVANNIESYTEFNQNHPFTGTVAKNETRLAGSGNAGLLKRTTNTYAQSPGSAGASVFVYPSQSVEESWDLSGTPYPSSTTSYVYGQSPQYGDPTQITVSNSEGSSKATVNEYWPVDSNNWILGRLKKASVTSVKP